MPPSLRMRAEPLWSRTGRGVSIAVIDSGAHPGHPHLGLLAGGIALTPDGSAHDNLTDRLGHGTAVTAAIQEKAPGARVHVARIFHDELATSARTLAKAIDWAGERSCRLANLSLGTPRQSRIEQLQPAVERAARAGTLVIAAFSHEGERWLPGSLPGALGVCLDWDLPRHRVRVGRRDGRASCMRRAIPGRSRASHRPGISTASASPWRTRPAWSPSRSNSSRDARGRADALAALEALAAV